MKNLKYIKLYKAFESLLTEAFGADHLNKVFNYLDRYHLRNAGDKNLN